MNISVQTCIWVFVLSSFGYNSEMELLHYTVILFNFLRNRHTVFHSGCTILHSYQYRTRGLVGVSISSPTLVILFDDEHPDGCEMVPRCGFDKHSIIINIYMSIAISMCSLEKCLFSKSFAPFWISLFSFFLLLLLLFWLLSCRNSSYTLVINPV